MKKKEFYSSHSLEVELKAVKEWSLVYIAYRSKRVDVEYF